MHLINNWLSLLGIIIDCAFILYAFKMGKEWLYASIVINLILISTFGSKIINIFGFTTNAGNAFYAGVFLATHMLTEHYGKRAGLKAIWMGFWSILFFTILSQLTVGYVSSNPSQTDSAMR